MWEYSKDHVVAMFTARCMAACVDERDWLMLQYTREVSAHWLQHVLW